ncbi:unnamed protein product [Prunus brigantina]
MHLPIQGERESELESLGLKNLGLELENKVFEDTALEKETTGRIEASDRSPIFEDETCGLCEETTMTSRLYMKIVTVILVWMRSMQYPPLPCQCPNLLVEMQNLQKYLASEFEMKSLGDLKYFLGIEVARSKQVSVVSQFMHSPSEDHMGDVMCILRYLKVTPGKGLMVCKCSHTDVEGYTDVDWAGSITDRRSTSGYFTFVAAIAIVHNPVQHDHTKHMEVDRHFVKEKLGAEIISFPFILSEYQLANVFTKVVSTTVFLNSLDKLGMRDIFAPT